MLKPSIRDVDAFHPSNLSTVSVDAIVTLGSPGGGEKKSILAVSPVIFQSFELHH